MGTPASASEQRDELGTSARILDVAERLVQERGFNAVSYADIAAELRLTKPALHYHFAGKAELGTALLTRYTERFGAALTALDTRRGAMAKLDGYATLYFDVLREDRMCLCGMLAAEYRTLPQPMQQAVLAFFADNESWLEAVLNAGSDAGELQFTGTYRDTARMIISCLEGAMLVARPFADTARFSTAATNLLASLIPAPANCRSAER
ncbi:MAG: regulatory protein TetR [Frankiales bacterium]|nr:regulatory protein TetR [Frankiales bacterium]